MLIRLTAALFMMLIAIPAVSAASFDCAKAATPIEQAICDDPHLSETDSVLAVAYATAIGGLSDEASNLMQDAQVAWLDFLADACADAVLPGQSDAKEERTFCVQTEYDWRIRGLEDSRMIGGLRFYVKDRFKALPDTTEDSWVKVATKKVSVPLLDGDSDLAQAFNDYMLGIDAGYDNLFDGTVGEEGDMVDGSPTTDNEEILTVVDVASSRITVESTDYWYGHGAAHGNYGISYIHFLREEMRPLEASDMFKGDAWQAKLADLAFDELKTMLGTDGLFISSPDEIVEAVSDPSRWSFSDYGLVVHFQPYEVTAYAAGAPTATVSWTALDGDLADTAYTYMY